MKKLLSGEHAADPTITTHNGMNALALAQQPNYDFAIIDESLKYQPREQALTITNVDK